MNSNKKSLFSKFISHLCVCGDSKPSQNVLEPRHVQRNESENYRQNRVEPVRPKPKKLVSKKLLRAHTEFDLEDIHVN